MASSKKWLDAVTQAGNDSREKNWIERSKRIVRRYRDEREMDSDGSRFNILWSNVETIFPAVYAQTPKAVVSRRNKDADPIARTAAQILERALQFEIDQKPDFDASIRAALLDRLLPGRGVVWIRFEQEEIATVTGGQPATPDITEYACVDYVYWEDFRCGPARTWADVPWVARREYLTKAAGKKRFGAVFAKVPMKQAPVGMDEMPNTQSEDKKAAVWEIWDKDSKKAYWVAEGYPEMLDEKPDPYGLEEFFPCPPPMYATQTTDQLTPVPDYSLYQDQAKEIDILTTRINGLTEALRLVGAYDASNSELARILQSDDNTLVPVNNWAGLSEKGGLAGVMQWIPLNEVVGALQAAYEAREQAKQVIYEITGISDIIRGATKASETFGAQDIKRQFGSLRLNNRQHQVALFATQILQIKAQLMMDLYSPETLVAMSGIEGTADAQYVDQALQLMQTEPLREYQISVAADSLIAMDEEQEKASRMEFLSAVGGYIEKAMAAAQSVPEIAPLALELMMFAVRAFPAAKPVEAAFEQFQSAIQNRQPTDPNAGARAEVEAKQQIEMAKLQQTMQVEQMKLQFQTQAKQAELQADAAANQIRAQADVQIQQAKLSLQSDLERQRAAMQVEMDRYKAQVEAESKAAIVNQEMVFQRWRAELDASVKIEVANIASKAKVSNAATETATAEISREVKP